MQRRHTFNRKLIALVFILAVIAGGVALKAANQLENPLAVVTQIQQFSSGEQPGFGEGAERRGPPGNSALTDGDEDEQFERAERSFPAEGMGNGLTSTSLTWSELDAVAFNLWFILATTAVVMVVGTPVGRLIKRLSGRQRQTPARAAA